MYTRGFLSTPRERRDLSFSFFRYSLPAKESLHFKSSGCCVQEETNAPGKNRKGEGYGERARSGGTNCRDETQNPAKSDDDARRMPPPPPPAVLDYCCDDDDDDGRCRTGERQVDAGRVVCWGTPQGAAFFSGGVGGNARTPHPARPPRVRPRGMTPDLLPGPHLLGTPSENAAVVEEEELVVSVFSPSTGVRPPRAARTSKKAILVCAGSLAQRFPPFVLGRFVVRS